MGLVTSKRMRVTAGPEATPLSHGSRGRPEAVVDPTVLTSRRPFSLWQAGREDPDLTFVERQASIGVVTIRQVRRTTAPRPGPDAPPGGDPRRPTTLCERPTKCRTTPDHTHRITCRSRQRSTTCCCGVWRSMSPPRTVLDPTVDAPACCAPAGRIRAALSAARTPPHTPRAARHASRPAHRCRRPEAARRCPPLPTRTGHPTPRLLAEPAALTRPVRSTTCGHRRCAARTRPRPPEQTPRPAPPPTSAPSAACTAGPTLPGGAREFPYRDDPGRLRPSCR